MRFEISVTFLRFVKELSDEEKDELRRYSGKGKGRK